MQPAFALPAAQRPRLVPLVLVIGVHIGLFYLFALGLKFVPTIFELPKDMTVVTVPQEPRPVEAVPEPMREDALFTRLTIPTQDQPRIVVEESPRIVGEVIDGPVQPRRTIVPVEPQIIQARLLQAPEPPYPLVSRARDEEGTVFVKVLLSPQGRVQAVQLDKTSGFQRLDEAALQAVKHWRFAPATRGGQGVETWVVVPVRFELRRGA